MAEGILAKHVANYDHFSMIDIPKHVGEKVVAEWRDVADRLEDMSSEQAHTALNLSAAYRDRVDGTPMNDAKTPEDAEELEDLLEAARGANWDAQHGPKHLRSGRYFSYEKPTSQGGASVARDAVVEPGIEDSRPLRGRRLTPTTFGGQGVRHLRAIPGYRDQ
ncbi:MAG: hypothetical protein KA712_14250 [Myxococcales bacterium]|nr:hypothetical protein [Myxococcales bacterium]